MTAAKLSKAQIARLREACRPEGLAMITVDGNAWRAVGGLIADGLVRVNAARSTFDATDAGQAALAARGVK